MTLQVAESFGTLETRYPNRVDLGLGRAPGTDQQTARILYRPASPKLVNNFDEQLSSAEKILLQAMTGEKFMGDLKGY